MHEDSYIQLKTIRLKVVLFTIFINVLAVIFFAQIPGSDWRTGVGLNLFDHAILLAYARMRGDRYLLRLLLFGLVLGFTELWADAWLVDYTGTLDYSPGGGPMIWRSPLWMPFAWEIVAVQFAVVGGWLVDRFRGIGLLLAGLAGAVNIPFYEEMALKTNWWAYRDCRMFLHTPYYIILGEFFIVMGIAVLSRFLHKPSLRMTALTGVMGGLMIFLSYALGFWIFE